MRAPVSVNNEWSTLREVVLGIASRLYWPDPGTVFLKETSPWCMVLIGRIGGALLAGRPMPRWTGALLAPELRELEMVLARHDVVVHRPDPIRPHPGEPAGLSQVFARDPVIVVGDTVILAAQKLPMLRKEIRGFGRLLDRIRAAGARVVRVPAEAEDTFIEGGDVLVDLPYVFVGVGELASNLNGARWLQEQLGPKVHVVAVPIVKRGVFHLDTCLTLIGPRTGIVCREALADPLPPPLCEYDLIAVDERTRAGLGTNVLMLDSRTVIAQRRHRRLLARLRARGFRTVALDFGWHALGGGAFRCATHPLRRAD
jgi:N-dimethylarginine dimethylaminohydrolase